MTWSRIHSAPLRVLPKPRPASSSQVRQSPFGACWLGRPHQPQSCSIASSSRSLVRFRNAASCSGGSDASNSAGETFSDSDNLDLDRITVRRTGVFVGAGFAPAAARLHPEDRGRDAGALVFECRFAGAAANSVEQKVSDLGVGPGGTRVELDTAMLAQGRLRDAEHARNVRFGNAVGGHRLGLPPLRVSRGPYRSSHWKIRPLRSATISATCIGCTFPPGDWDGVRKNEVTGSNSYSKIIARYRQDSAGRARRLAGDGTGLACPLRGDVVEASTVAVEHRLLASKLLPALHRDIDISRRDFNRVAHAAGYLSRDYRRARAAERLVDGLPGRRIILDRPAHALDRLLRAVAGFRFQIFVDLPQRRLTMVADPRRGATLAHHVPARLVLAVVMAAADREVVFGPNDLRAGLEAAGG